jgi:hypothetical protein
MVLHADEFRPAIRRCTELHHCELVCLVWKRKRVSIFLRPMLHGAVLPKPAEQLHAASGEVER